jgi:uncharacterized protein YuzE
MNPCPRGWLPLHLISGDEVMKITYDAEVDALYIRFIEATVTTQHVVEGIAIDYTADGRIAGIEILNARKRFGDPEVFRRVVLEDITTVAPEAAKRQ